MKYRLFTDSESAWQGMLDAINSAQKSIYLEMYIFENDTASHDFVSALEKKCKDKIKVILIVDIFGSLNLNNNWVKRLREAGCEVLFFSYWFQRTHRKILIVDEKIAFVGGVNIGSQFALWKDLQVRFEGSGVYFATKSFAKMYKKSGGLDETILAYGKPRFWKRTRIWFIEHGVGRRRRELREVYTKHISEAKSTIIFVTPYFLPPRWLIAHIHLAVLKGIQVELLIPKTTNHYIINKINYYYINIFRKLGVKCLLQNSMNHSKAMLIDNRIGLIGSHNLDQLSFDWNIEAGVFINDSGIVNELSNTIDTWKKNSTLFDPNHYKYKWLDKFLSEILAFFSKIL